ncbi:MFS transporter [Sphingorhabdus sp. YGSMI21]|uniref:MFS transporter n=1 Tax=Sphingorhabdus sp. YGSMI21 TaxID=2077182 RepID=UPI000C1F2EE0|nr:MFS transporter [Sphingorhabdus sp. YGSMI21]ATW04731.1 MFS transporter [Sphingorhabdus sp. YGSMI21]
MTTRLIPLSALLLGSLFLLIAGGINGLILPLRGSEEGFSAFSLGLLGTGWAAGYVLGCLYTPLLVSRVGHIRVFGTLAATAAIAILLSAMFPSPWSWIPLRAVSGFCFAGAAMIVESWLNEEVDSSIRGRVFGTYTMINLVGTTGGQMILIGADISTAWFFMLAAIFYCLALIPTTISSNRAPSPLFEVKLNIPQLWRNSPVAVFAVLMIGISNGSFGALAPVYANNIGLDVTAIVLFCSVPILAGALSQIPVGRASDRSDRRKVLIFLALVAMAADGAFIFLRPDTGIANILISALLGAAIFAMYPIVVAHANDHADPGQFIQTSGGLLMVFGIGSIVGPFIAGLALTFFGPMALFSTLFAAHLSIVLFALLRVWRREQVDAEDKASFQNIPFARNSTPETEVLADRENHA